MPLAIAVALVFKTKTTDIEARQRLPRIYSGRSTLAGNLGAMNELASGPTWIDV